MDIYDCINDFLAYQRMIGSQDKTITHYKAVLDSFAGTAAAFPPTIQDVYSFAALMDKRCLSVATKANYLRHLKAFYHFMCNSSVIDDKSLWREIRLPRDSKKIVQIYSDSEIQRIYDFCSSCGGLLAARDRLIVSFMLDCGLRLSEVVKLEVSDVCSDLVLVHGKGRKDRLVPIGMQLRADFENYMLLRPPQVEHSRLLLTRSLSPIQNNTIKLLYQRMSKNIGFRVSAHRLRHNFATNFLLDSYELSGKFDCYTLMVLLGHEDISTTERYLHYAQQVIACRSGCSHLDIINKRKNT